MYILIKNTHTMNKIINKSISEMCQTNFSNIVKFSSFKKIYKSIYKKKWSFFSAASF